MELGSAFGPYLPVGSLESLPLPQPKPYSLPLQASAGILRWQEGRNNKEPANEWQTTQDGRMNVTVGMQSSLLGKRYRIVSILGEGTSAQVLLAQDEYRGQKLVAVKMMKRQFFFAGQKEARLMRWLALKAPLAAVPRLQDFLVHRTHACLVMDQMFHNLLDVIVQASTWPADVLLKAVRSIALQLLTTVADFHSLGLVHADLKPENILLDTPLESDWRAFHASNLQIIDYGSAFVSASIDTGAVSFEAQSLPYRAPEVVHKRACGPPADIWSLGCILSELLLHQPLFPADSPSSLLRMIQNTLSAVKVSPDAQQTHAPAHRDVGTTQQAAAPLAAPSIVPSMAPLESKICSKPRLYIDLAHHSPLAADFIMQMLQENPVQRAMARQLLSHPFLAPILPVRHLQPPEPPPMKTSQLQATVPHTPLAEIPVLAHNNVLTSRSAHIPDHAHEEMAVSANPPDLVPQRESPAPVDPVTPAEPQKVLDRQGEDGGASPALQEEERDLQTGSASGPPGLSPRVNADGLGPEKEVMKAVDGDGGRELLKPDVESAAEGTGRRTEEGPSLVDYDTATDEERQAAEILEQLSSLPPSSWSTGPRKSPARRTRKPPAAGVGRHDIETTPQSRIKTAAKHRKKEAAKKEVTPTGATASRLKVRRPKKRTQAKKARKKAARMESANEAETGPALPVQSPNRKQKVKQRPLQRTDITPKGRWSLPASGSTTGGTVYANTPADCTSGSQMVSWNPLLAGMGSREVTKPTGRSAQATPQSRRLRFASPDLRGSKRSAEVPELIPPARLKQKKVKKSSAKGGRLASREVIALGTPLKLKSRTKQGTPAAAQQNSTHQYRRSPRSRAEQATNVLTQDLPHTKPLRSAPEQSTTEHENAKAREDASGQAVVKIRSPFARSPRKQDALQEKPGQPEEEPPDDRRQKRLKTSMADQPSSTRSSAEMHHDNLPRRISSRRTTQPKEWWKADV